MQKSQASAKTEFLLQLGQALKGYREEKGFSQFTLSVESGLPKTQIGRIKLGEVNTTIYTLKKITDALGVTISEFFASLGTEKA